MEKMICKNGHGFGEKCVLEYCPYCNTKLVLKEYTPGEVEKTRVWFKQTCEAKRYFMEPEKSEKTQGTEPWIIE